MNTDFEFVFRRGFIVWLLLRFSYFKQNLGGSFLHLRFPSSPCSYHVLFSKEERKRAVLGREKKTVSEYNGFSLFLFNYFCFIFFNML